ncbi:MAG: hypothetical protein IKV94_03990 [Clostridia bacterium]|nr:hypothetical protein [Clostridia bacterium]
MCHRKYQNLFINTLKESFPAKYARLKNINKLDKYVEIQNKYLTNYLDRLKESIAKQYPAPKTNEFLVMVKYNQMIENLVHEYMVNEITNIIKG